MKQKILDCKQQNPTWGYRKIAKHLSVSITAVRYYVCPTAKAYTIRKAKEYDNNAHPLRRKLQRFYGKYRSMGGKLKALAEPAISLKDALAFFGENPTCYLTGEKIDLLKAKTYSLDHKIARNKGGHCGLSNMGLTSKQANLAKSDLSLQEFILICRKVVALHGEL